MQISKLTLYILKILMKNIAVIFLLITLSLGMKVSNHEGLSFTNLKTSVLKLPLDLRTVSSTTCKSDECAVHWVFGLDESGSMNGEQWKKVLLLMNSVGDHLKSVGRQKMTVFTFDNRATLPPKQYFQFGDPSAWNSSKLPKESYGGTNFGQPLIRAIQFILLHQSSNTCYVMLTDGEAAYPSIQVELFKSVKKYMTDKGKQFCSLCYYIMEGNKTDAPTAYKQLCKNIGAETPAVAASAGVRSVSSTTSMDAKVDVYSVPVDNLDVAILSSFKEAVKKEIS